MHMMLMRSDDPHGESGKDFIFRCKIPGSFRQGQFIGFVALFVHRFYGKAGSLEDILGALETKAQRMLGVDRTKKYGNIVFQKGRNWFSITHGLASLVVEKEAWIREVFGQSVCGDELFLQTIARNSEYADNICNANTMPDIPDTRYIDWERGSNNNPYIFRESDFEELKSAAGLFARKFDWNTDKTIVEKLCAELNR